MTSKLLIKNARMLACPTCQGELDLGSGQISCSVCGDVFTSSEDGIPLLFRANDWAGARADVTDSIKSFYEENPFPNYDDLDSSAALRQKAERGVFARLLDEQIPFGAKILEVGCGTGQLSNFLGMTWGRTVMGADLCLNSLRLAQRFREENQIENVAFLQMNLFRPAFKPGSFDVLVSNGVLHHTGDPFLGFQTISRLLKIGGICVIGLYNKYSRLTTDWRRFLFKVTGDHLQFLDPRLRDKNANELRKRTWFMDQYKNPCESKHTIGEVQHWFDVSGFEFMNSIPKSSAESFSPQEKLFEVHPRGDKFDHFIVQFSELLTGGRDGGFFVMIGRRVAEKAR